MLRIMTRSTPPGTDPCTLLAQAQQQMQLLLRGQAAVAIETPHLGRGAVNKADVGQLQRYIDYLTGQCNAQNGQATAVRIPYSFEALP